MTKVINKSGQETDYDYAVSLMDDEIREELHGELAPCTDQEFYTAYLEKHFAKYGEEFQS